MLRSFFIALSFLTTIPSPKIDNWQEDDFAKSLRAYPLVGLLIASILLLFAYALSSTQPLLASALSISLWFILTGGLHFDGLCDIADAVFASKSPIERQEIAKDPRIGSFAFLAGSLVIILKIAALQAMPDFSLMFFVPLIARSIILLIIPVFPVQENSQIAKMLENTKVISMWTVLYALGLILGLAILFAKFYLILASLLVAVSFAFLLAFWVNKRMQGLNGDSYGAIIELTELLLLLYFAFLT